MLTIAAICESGWVPADAVFTLLRRRMESWRLLRLPARVLLPPNGHQPQLPSSMGAWPRPAPDSCLTIKCKRPKPAAATWDSVLAPFPSPVAALTTPTQPDSPPLPLHPQQSLFEVGRESTPLSDLNFFLNYFVPVYCMPSSSLESSFKYILAVLANVMTYFSFALKFDRDFQLKILICLDILIVRGRWSS